MAPTLKLLDYVSSPYRDQIDLGHAPDWHQRIEVALNRLQQRDPHLATELREKIKEFDKIAYFPMKTDLHQLPYDDSKYLSLPKCSSGRLAEVYQLAIQTDGQFVGEPLYTINGDLWARMTDPTQRAGLVLHEVLYRKAREGGAPDSLGPQYLNALLATPLGLSRVTDQQYFNNLFAPVFSSMYYIEMPQTRILWRLLELTSDFKIDLGKMAQKDDDGIFKKILDGDATYCGDSP